MGHEKSLRALQQSKRMFAGELSPLEFLKSLDREMIRVITNACAHIAISRHEALLKLQIKLSK
jgi:CRISPR/Cas system-associated endoribonuclease Cas2